MTGMIRKFTATRTRLAVRRCRLAIAVAALRGDRGLRWTALLHPRHARAREEAQDDTVRWEDLLRPRDPGGR